MSKCSAYFIGVSSGKQAKRTCPLIFVEDLTGDLAGAYFFSNIQIEQTSLSSPIPIAPMDMKGQ